MSEIQLKIVYKSLIFVLAFIEKLSNNKNTKYEQSWRVMIC